jgi:hypothetical protein
VIYVKGSHIKFELVSGEILSLPKSFGIIHDQEGQDIPRCEVYFGPFKVIGRDAGLTPAARAYFGDAYHPDRVSVDLPEGSWNPISEVVQIFYRRPSGVRVAKHTGKYHHPFKKVARPTLLKAAHERFYKFEMTSFCIIDDRGFVFP